MAEKACSPCRVMKPIGSEVEVVLCWRLLVTQKFAIKEMLKSDVVESQWQAIAQL